jgi:hypothetical protein
MVEQNLLAATVIELGSTAVSVPGNALCGLKGTVIYQKIGDAGDSERVRRSQSA